MSYWYQDTPDALGRKLEFSRIITFILTGVFCREMVVALPHDWGIVRGGRCCGVAGAVLYFLTRHTTTAALCTDIATITKSISGLSDNALAVIVHVRQGLILMSNVLAYQIFVIRVTAIWRLPLVGWSLYGAMLALWILNLYASTSVRGAFDNSTLTNVIFVMMTTTMTAVFILCILGLLRAHRLHDFPTAHPSDAYRGRTTVYMLYHEGALRFFISWAVQVVIFVIDLVNFDPQRIIMAVLGITILVVTVICACRVHQDMVNRSTVSALSHSPSLTLAIAALVRKDVRRVPQGPAPTISTSHLQLYRAPSVLSRLTMNSWRSGHTNPTAESVELSVFGK